MIYQWNATTHAYVKSYGALYQIQRDLGLSMDDVISAMSKRHPVGGFLFTRTPMIDLDETGERKQKLDVKTTLMMSNKMADEFITLVGQRNKQEIIRGLIGDWIKKEKKNGKP